MIFLVYEALSHWGVFEGIQSRSDQAWGFYQALRDRWTESNENVAEFISFVDSTYSVVADFVEPWRLLAYGSCIWFFYWFWRDVGSSSSSGSTSPTSSNATTPDSTPPITPRSDPTKVALNSMASALDRQEKLLETLTNRQFEFEEKLLDRWESSRAQ